MSIAAAALLGWARDVFGVRRVYSRYVLVISLFSLILY